MCCNKFHEKEYFNSKKIHFVSLVVEWQGPIGSHSFPNSQLSALVGYIRSASIDVGLGIFLFSDMELAGAPEKGP